jgi:hypothetical protein
MRYEAILLDLFIRGVFIYGSGFPRLPLSASFLPEIMESSSSKGKNAVPGRRGWRDCGNLGDEGL